MAVSPNDAGTVVGTGAHIVSAVGTNGVIDGATRIDPVATSAQRAFWFAKDWAREQYQGLLFSLPVDGTVASVRFRLQGKLPVLLFAVTAERD